MMDACALIKYIRSFGINVNTKTKARGHFGFFIDGRIDISKNTPQEKFVPTLLHEFAHYVHSRYEDNVAKTGGSLNIIFKTEENLEEELFKLTTFIDENSKCEKLFKHKELIKAEIKKLDGLIKSAYPDFKRSKQFKPFNKAIRGSNLKYLLKYDKVRIMPWFIFGKEEILSIANLEQDFPKLKPEFANYIRLKSLMRKQKRISNRISKRQKYYKRPTELFARFVEGLYINEALVQEIAPKTYFLFFELLAKGYLNELKPIFSKDDIVTMV